MSAHIWNLIVVVFWLLIFVSDAISQSIITWDWFLLGFLGLALLGLLAA